jgi:hypothetical protein
MGKGFKMRKEGGFRLGIVEFNVEIMENNGG